MDRRDFMKGASLAGAMSLLPLAEFAAADETEASARGESGQAYADLARALKDHINYITKLLIDTQAIVIIEEKKSTIRKLNT